MGTQMPGFLAPSSGQGSGVGSLDTLHSPISQGLPSGHSLCSPMPWFPWQVLCTRGVVGRQRSPHLPPGIIPRQRQLQLLRIRQQEAKKRPSPGPPEGSYRRKPPPATRFPGDVLAPVSTSCISGGSPHVMLGPWALYCSPESAASDPTNPLPTSRATSRA